MDQYSPVMVVIQEEASRGFANQVASSMGAPVADVVIGSPMDAATALANRSVLPKYIVIDIGGRAEDVLPELDVMAENCESGTRVVIIGNINDVRFYRELRQRGITEYFTQPVRVTDIRGAFIQDGLLSSAASDSTVVSFMSAASGDGSSTLALNTAYMLAERFGQPTVLVDMDFQFGMIAKNLDLSTPFGIKELFEHPDRGIDTTLVERMLVNYGNNLKVIAAPNDLRLMPDIKPEIIRDLIITLQQQFKFVIIDLPHVWSMWVASALSNSTHNIMVSQLWLRSVTHASRLLNSWQGIGIESDAISTVINRSGAKFKEAVSAVDYERVCNRQINFYVANDIKAIAAAENQGKTLIEVGGSVIDRQINEIAKSLVKIKGNAQIAGAGDTGEIKSGLTSLFNKKSR